MAEFLFLFRGGNEPGATPSPEQMQAQMQKWNVWMGDLAKQGKLAGAQPLAATGKLVHGKSKVVTDGPFAEGKEVIGGYLLCTAGNMDEAIDISMGCPILLHDNGTVEIRPVTAM